MEGREVIGAGEGPRAEGLEEGGTGGREERFSSFRLSGILPCNWRDRKDWERERGGRKGEKERGRERREGGGGGRREREREREGEREEEERGGRKDND